jgi:ArsR family transcriptional regulator
VPRAVIHAENAHEMAEMLKSLGHPIRLQLVAILCESDERVGELAERLGIKPSIVSQQLRILRMTGLVEVTRDGGVARYTLAEPRLIELLGCMAHCRR